MIITKTICNKLTNFIQDNTATSKENIKIINYGLTILISNLIKLIILLGTAYFLDILSYTVIALISFSIVRLSSSGTHANSTITCILTNYILFLGNVFLSINYQFNILDLSIIFIISLIILIKYSPAGTIKRPIISKKLRLKLKIISIISLCLTFIFAISLNNSIYKTIISIANFEAALSTTPFMYKLFGNYHRNYDNFTL